MTSHAKFVWTLAFVLSMLFCSLARAVPRVVTISRGAEAPAVSPDGKTIAVGILGKIWLVPISGGEARQLTFTAGWDRHPAWSPDGHFIAFEHLQPKSTELMIYDLRGGISRTLWQSSGEIFQIAFRPTRPEDDRYFVCGANNRTHISLRCPRWK